MFVLGLMRNFAENYAFLERRLHNNLSAAVITAHRSEVSSFI